MHNCKKYNLCKSIIDKSTTRRKNANIENIFRWIRRNSIIFSVLSLYNGVYEKTSCRPQFAADSREQRSRERAHAVSNHLGKVPWKLHGIGEDITVSRRFGNCSVTRAKLVFRGRNLRDGRVGQTGIEIHPED